MKQKIWFLKMIKKIGELSARQTNKKKREDANK